MGGPRWQCNLSSMMWILLMLVITHVVPVKCANQTTESPTPTLSTTEDTIPPEATFVGCPDNILTNNATVDYTEPTATEGDVNLTVSCDPSSGSTFSDKQATQVVCTAADAVGNVALKNCNFTVTVDITPPVATFDSCPSDNIFTNNATVVYTEPAATEGDVHLTVSCDPPSGSVFMENQDTTVICNAADEAGNIADKTCTFIVSVDTIPPEATFVGCPDNVLTNNATVDYTEPTATEGDVKLTVSCDPPSGSVFMENQDTAVICNAADAAGNIANESCTFNITVDTMPPVLDQGTCPADMSQFADYATNSTLVMWKDPTASDNIDPQPNVTCLPPSNSEFEIGERTVECTAKDAAGNDAVSPCTFIVSVTELRAPTIDNITGVTNETMVIAWSSLDIVENFTVEYRGTFEDTETKNTTLPGSLNNYQLTDLLPGETYVVKVIAKSGLALAESKEKQRTTELNEPTITNITSVTMSTMDLEWRKPLNSFVERYIISYTGVKEDTEMRNKTLDNSTLKTTLDNLLPGETYKLRVIASSGSIESQEVFAESQERQETTVPTSVVLEEIDSTVNSITAQWPAPTDQQQPSFTPVIEYYIIKCQEGTPEPARINYTSSRSQASCIDLPFAGREYTITVESHSRDKSFSASIQIIALPNGVALIEGESTTLSVSSLWVYPGGDADHFNISCSEGTPQPEEIPIGNTTQPPFYEASCVNLSIPGYTYTMTVYVESEGKQSNSSHIQLIALPEKVINLQADSFTTEVIISWSIPLVGIVTSFNVSYSGGEPKTIQHKSGMTSYQTNFTDLVPGREYSFNVRALSGDKQSAVETINQRTVPSQITEFATKSTTKTSITVTWNEVVGDKDRYNATINPFEGNLEDRNPLDPTATFSSLIPGKMYSVSVVTVSGESSSSPFVETLSTEPDLPGPVSALTIDDINLHSVTLKFNKPAKPNGNLSSFYIKYVGKWKENTDPEKSQNVAFDQIPITVEDLLAGYTYNFTVQARNEAGLGEAKSKSATTLTKSPDSSAKPEPFVDQNESTKPTTTTIVARFLDNYFSHSNGQLINYTVIIAQDGTGENTVPATTQTWSDVKDKDPIPPYQAFSARPYPFPPDLSGQRKRRATTREEKVTLGDEECQSTSGYCNGPLRDDTSYVYLFRVWNEAGYADTAFSEPVKTFNDISLEVGLGLGVSFAILFIICIVLLMLAIKRRQRFSRRRSSTDYWNEGFERDVIPVGRKGNKRPIPVEEFPEYFRSMKADSDYLFSEEYEELRPIGRNQAAEAAVFDVNRSKNRFTNILPYDHTRVKLKQVDDEEGSDYINANFMPGYNSPREFIACQGPLPGTEDDMWRLVWEQKISTIVMVTQLVEKGRVKCHKYWPSLEKPVYFGNILVTLLSEVKLQLWTVREFMIEKGEKRHQVRHFNFTAWPDHGVPDSCDGILQFVRTVRNQIPDNGKPTLVHCSAGVGRTGTFICLDHLLLHLKENRDVDVFGIVCEMRMHRNFMVQTEDQYVFIHECIMDILQALHSNGSSPVYENMFV
ncbi:tyrosine-protein phosphatase 10D-like isoform X2 [Acanthaster planci]|uniref:protein-tyrosine-phosphatase n=1 Tax=Acanthaster planci TaxID=133434 RepID=A0A8B7YRA6_ACAPL|nr:tyrosine-protein phosphatase 10D-like isoform X2 [Acanthaster planci]